MRADLSDLSLIQDLADSEYDLFKRALRTLLAHSFILREFPHEEKLYDFTIRNMALFEAWCSCADIELTRDESLGVIACRSGHEMRLRLGREETCALLCFRLLFEEKRRELSLAQGCAVSILDFLQRYRALTDRELPKTRFTEVLRRFSRYRLVAFKGELNDAEALIVLYPSLALALDQGALEETLAALERDKALSGARQGEGPAEPEPHRAGDAGDDPVDESGAVADSDDAFEEAGEEEGE